MPFRLRNALLDRVAEGTEGVAAIATLRFALNTISLTGFGGNRVVWVAGRDTTNSNNTDWQAMGTWTVQ
jgi:hypothetical protein